MAPAPGLRVTAATYLRPSLAGRLTYARPGTQVSVVRASVPPLGERLLVLGLCERIKERAPTRDGRADCSKGRELVPEDEDRGQDDAHALDGVSNRVGDGRNLVESDKCDLVVGIVVEAIENHLADQPRCTDDGGRGLPRSREAGALIIDSEGEREGERDDGEDAVEIGRAHVFADGLVHSRFREHGTRGEGYVRGDSAVEGLPGERELLERGEGDAGYYGEERGVHGPLEDGTENEVRKHARENRLRRLDRLREGNCAGAEGDDSAGVAEGVCRTDRKKGLPGARVELGCLADARRPKKQDTRNTNEERDDRHGPRHGKGILALFVSDVVHDVEGEPREKAKAEL